MFIHFRINAYKREKIPEIRRYFELYSDEITITEPEKEEAYFQVRASPLTYQNLFSVVLFHTEQGWQQHGACRIPDSLDDVVKSVELCED